MRPNSLIINSSDKWLRRRRRCDTAAGEAAFEFAFSAPPAGRESAHAPSTQTARGQSSAVGAHASRAPGPRRAPVSGLAGTSRARAGCDLMSSRPFRAGCVGGPMDSSAATSAATSCSWRLQMAAAAQHQQQPSAAAANGPKQNEWQFDEQLHGSSAELRPSSRIMQPSAGSRPWAALVNADGLDFPSRPATILQLAEQQPQRRNPAPTKQRPLDDTAARFTCCRPPLAAWAPTQSGPKPDHWHALGLWASLALA